MTNNDGRGIGFKAHLPENDRISINARPAACKDLLRRLLALNHQRAAEEEKARAAGTAAPVKGKGRKARKGGQGEGFFSE